MLRQAGRVTRTCASCTRLLPWPAAAPLPLRLRHPRYFQTTLRPAVSETGLPIGNTPRTEHSDEVHNRHEPAPSSSPPQQNRQPKKEHTNRKHSGSSRSSEPTSWVLRKNRLNSQLPGLREEAKRTGQELETLIKTFREWDKQFYALWGRLNGDKTNPPKPATRPATTRVLDELLACKTVEDAASCWAARSEDNRRLQWTGMMMATMNLHPERTAALLEATLEPDVTPAWAVADVFCFLVKRSNTLPQPHQRQQERKLPRLLFHLLRTSSPRQFQLQQWVLGALIRFCPAEMVPDLHAELIQYRHPIHWNTKFHMANRLAENVKYKLVALQMLEDIVKRGKADVNDRRCAALATAILTMPPDWDSGRDSPVDVHVVVEAFERIVGLGISPNIITCTAMIRTLCRSNQLDSAWKIYDVMKSRQMPLDRVVFGVLLNGAKQSRDLDAVVRVLEDAPAGVWQDAIMGNELIDTILKLAIAEAKVKAPPRVYAFVPAFYTMLQVYAKFFKLEPLQSVIPYDLRGSLAARPQGSADDNCDWKAKLAFVLDELPVCPPEALAEPDTKTLSIMVIGYIRTLNAAYPILSFYSHFKNLLRNREPTALALANRDAALFNIILHALTEHPGMLRVAIDIVNDMIADAANSATDVGEPPTPDTIPAAGAAGLGPGEQGPDAAPEGTAATTQARSNPKRFTRPAFQQAPPNVRTWSILLHAFIRQRRIDQAERILRVMRTHGVEPDRVTYNMLVASYSATGDTDRVTEVIDQLDRAGFHPDTYTFRGVSKLDDPEPALALMEARTAERYAERRRELEDALAAVPRPDEDAAEATAEGNDAKAEAEWATREWKQRWWQRQVREEARKIMAASARNHLDSLERRREKKRREMEQGESDGEAPARAQEEASSDAQNKAKEFDVFKVSARERRARRFLKMVEMEVASRMASKERAGEIAKETEQAANKEEGRRGLKKGKNATSTDAPTTNPMEEQTPDVPGTIITAATTRDTPSPAEAVTGTEAATRAVDNMSTEELESFMQGYEDTVMQQGRPKTNPYRREAEPQPGGAENPAPGQAPATEAR